MITFASTTLVLFSDNGPPSPIAGNAERYFIFAVARQAAGDIVHRLDSDFALRANDTHVIGPERGTGLARQRDLSFAGDFGDFYDVIHALLHY
jgi:hypothetical protein